eukprot:Clim_evm47s229 gene=Clim_evmTU47s229
MSYVVVYGGKGALGGQCVSAFKASGLNVISIDFKPNEEAVGNIVLKFEQSFEEQEQAVLSGLKEALGDKKLSAVVCVAGGWAGGNAASDELVKNTDLMIKQSVWTSIISARVSSQFLEENGLLVLTGAVPALKGTSFMLGYGLAKAAVHQLVQGLAQDDSGMPKGATTIAILPTTLSTPMNLKFMPDADHSKWTSLEEVASGLLKRITEPTSREANGSLVQILTADGQTEWKPAQITIA